MANGAVNPGSNAKGTGTAGSSVGKNVGGRLPRRGWPNGPPTPWLSISPRSHPAPRLRMRPQALQSPVATADGDKPDGEFAASGSDEPKEHGGDIQSGELRSLRLIITIGMPDMREAPRLNRALLSWIKVSGICRVRLTGPSSWC